MTVLDRTPHLTRQLATAWILVLGGYAATVSLIPAGSHRTAFGDIFLCVLPLLVNGALLINAITSDWRKNAFWMLLAVGSTFWMAGQLIWTYVEVYQYHTVPNPFFGDVVYFLHTVPMIAALAIQPHVREDTQKMVFGYVDFLLLLLWWVYLYLYVVLPWQYVSLNPLRHYESYNVIYGLENYVFVAGAATLWWHATGHWRRVYMCLTAGGATYLAGSLGANLLFHPDTYSPGSLWDLPLIASFLWLGSAGVMAYAAPDANEKVYGETADGTSAAKNQSSEALWASSLARTAMLSLPLLGLWAATLSHAPQAVREFRILVTLVAILPLGFLVFLRHELMDTERLRLLRASQESIDNLKRLQMQFVQAEKLASLGQLAAGAAHEINNPLTAILGYSDLLLDDPSIGGRPRNIAEKIREQARRTNTLVTNLLSFARQTPNDQRMLLDVNTVVNNSVQLRRLDLRGKNIRIELRTAASLPAVRGDANQLLQVFFNIISNAVDAMDEVGGGTLTVTTMAEQAHVVILFCDMGPGIREPHLVFDPFYTTKPVGKGTGLGLSICYGVLRDHGGDISCFNRAEGGATFRVELPAVAPLSATRVLSSLPHSTSEKSG